MGITRRWLDWQHPCLPAAATWLLDELAATGADDDGRVADLGRVICVTPGKRAGRVLLEHLLRESQQRGVQLIPPHTVTPGPLVDLIAPTAAQQPSASRGESLMAWATALRDAGPDAQPLTPRPPARDDLLAWHDLAATVQKLHSELAGQRLGFDDVAEQAERLELFGESERWRALAAVHRRYRETLAAAHLIDAHEAREQALASASQQPHEHAAHIVLISIVELNALQRAALEICRTPTTVTALIHAPQSLSDRFDACGCVISEAWAAQSIELNEQQIIVADRPDDQAQAALRTIAAFDGRYGSDEITIGLGDAALGENVEHAARWADLAVHAADGAPLPRCGPYRLLAAVADWLQSRRFADFAALLRHSDLELYLHAALHSGSGDNGHVSRAIGDWIALLDNYFTAHLHQQLAGQWLGDAPRGLKAVYDEVADLLSPLSDRACKPLAEWIEPALSVLRAVYGKRTLSPRTRDACLALRDAFAAQAAIVPDLQPSVDAGTALRLMLRDAARESVAAPFREDQIELLGWLELHLDPAPALVALGINDGAVPESVTADAFLPDGLRARLGLASNAQRYARDAYLLQAMVHSREVVALITGRRAASNEPLTPSRLLLACDESALPQRVMRLCGEEPPQRWRIPVGAPSPREDCRFIELPAPPSEPPTIERMSVTSFRQYLQCPYRFWLGYIQRLNAASDDAQELDAMQFGSLAHLVLRRFGEDENIRDSADADAIASYLNDATDQCAKELYGLHPPPAVRVQLARLKRRLQAFAQHQARWRSEGWIITHCEHRLADDTYLDVPGQEPMRVTGIIDRIDYNEAARAYRIIDYKTSEAGSTPFETHHGAKRYNGTWQDLQLPLYHHLAPRERDAERVEVGYIVLPKKAENLAFLAAQWTDEQLEEAIATAQDVVRNVRAGAFDPNPDYSSPFDDFAVICRTNVLGGEDEGEGEPE